jgi:uncharacterized membrane protein YhaH (DUF805 family)
MGALSPIHLVILIIELALFVFGIVALVRILRRLGYSGWWLLLMFVPIANVVGLWKLSKATWPAVINPPSA